MGKYKFYVGVKDPDVIASIKDVFENKRKFEERISNFVKWFNPYAIDVVFCDYHSESGVIKTEFEAVGVQYADFLLLSDDWEETDWSSKNGVVYILPKKSSQRYAEWAELLGETSFDLTEVNKLVFESHDLKKAKIKTVYINPKQGEASFIGIESSEDSDSIKLNKSFYKVKVMDSHTLPPNVGW